MFIKPYQPPADYVMPCFIVHASDRFVTIRTELGDDVEITNLERWATSKRCLYSLVSKDTLTLYGDETLWTLATWNNKLTKMSYGPTVIYPLGVEGWDHTLPDFFEALWGTYGITPSSLNSMALKLWRTTIGTPMAFQENTSSEILPGLPTSSVPMIGDLMGPMSVGIGGRKEAPYRSTFYDVCEYDIQAAYPNAMFGFMPSTLRSIWSPDHLRNLRLDEWTGIARARVRIPPYDWGPLPLPLDDGHTVLSYGHTGDGWRTVTLPIAELNMAECVGSDVSVIDAHMVPTAEDNGPFAEWVVSVLPWLRSQPGLAGVIGKTLANRLWSCFAISSEGKRYEHTFQQGVLISRELDRDTPGSVLRRDRAAYVGAIIASRVRCRVYTEGILHYGGCLYVDTDGVIAEAGQEPLPGWRVKNPMRMIEIAGPQMYKYHCPKCLQAPYGHERPHMVVAGGTTKEHKDRLFKAMQRGGYTTGPTSMTLGPMVVNDENAVRDDNIEETIASLPFTLTRSS